MPDDPIIPAYLCRRVTRETVESFTLDELAVLGEIQSRRSNWPEVLALLSAGWSIAWADNSDDCEPFAWRWRRPSRREGKPGRLFVSTGQAFNAMKKMNQ